MGIALTHAGGVGEAERRTGSLPAGGAGGVGAGEK